MLAYDSDSTIVVLKKRKQRQMQ